MRQSGKTSRTLTFMPRLVKNVPHDLQSSIQTLCTGAGGAEAGGGGGKYCMRGTYQGGGCWGVGAGCALACEGSRGGL